MPKPVKKKAPKPAVNPMDEDMGRPEEGPEPIFRPTDDLDTRAIISAYMKVLGTKGGKVSGAKRMENLSDRQRKEIARKAAVARWKPKD